MKIDSTDCDMTVRDARSKWPISRFWETGFAVAAKESPRLGGLVHIYDGDRPIYQCLICRVEERASEILFEFKRVSRISLRPPSDFATPPMDSGTGDIRHML